MKKILLTILLGVSLFSLTSCEGGKKGKDDPTPIDSKKLELAASKTSVIIGTKIPINVTMNKEKVYKNIDLVENNDVILISQNNELFIVPVKVGNTEVKVTDGKEISNAITIKSSYSTMPEDRKRDGIYVLTTDYFKESIWDFEAYPDKIISRVDKPTIVKYTAVWCKPCQAYNQIMHELAHEYEGRAYVVEVDTDLNPDTYSKACKSFGLGNPGIPFFLFLAPGQEATYTIKTTKAAVMEFFDNNIQ